MISCSDRLEAMSAFLDGAPDADLEAHLASCPSCRRDLDALRQSDELLRAQPRLSWTPRLTAAVLAHARRRANGFWVLPVAAIVLMGITIVLARPRSVAPEPIAVDREALADHVRAVELLTAEDPPPDEEVLQLQVEHLGLRDAETRLHRSPVPEEIRNYLNQTQEVLSRDGRETKRFLVLRTEATDLAGRYRLPARSFHPSGRDTTSDVALFGIARIQLSSRRREEAVKTLQTLIEGHPDSRYVGTAHLELARHYLRNNDPIPALSHYSSVGECATPQVATEVKSAGDQAGTVIVGGRALAGMAPASLQTQIRNRAAFAWVRGREVTILGPKEHSRNLGDLPVSRVRYERGLAVLLVDKMEERDCARLTSQVRETLRVVR